MSSHELVITSGEALTEVARLLSVIDAETAADAMARSAIVEARRQGPMVLAVAGRDEASRTAFLNGLLGEALLSERRTAPLGGVIRFQRGSNFEYCARRATGAVDTFSHRHPDKRAEVEAAAAAAASDAD